MKLTSGTKLTGQDSYKYYTGVSGIKGLLLENWKQLKSYSQANNRDFYKVFYDHRKEPSKLLIDKYRNVLNGERVKEIRKDNLNFFYILQSLGIKGIVTMDIDSWRDAGGHTTLWNGSKFLDDTNYLNDERDYVFVRELCFWELK
ncbi:type VI secretion system amidase effector protein Tae4 [Helicobacter sp. MIT 14-3879]|uniref:type VI secretion system amidase effector protein Tae4 n=1 Tax=Helicobacter sp. MIT 14-3879 TaxID=2040649 RepID=UPI002161438C|nr:type VI secretion system amidase effector protein Tae4 [Helicobacter sp. MIT 14-3879]